MIRADDELRYLKGVGPRRADKLAEQSLVTVEDLLYVFPVRYEDRRRFGRVADLRPAGGESTLSVEVVSSRLIRTRRRGFTIFEAQVSDGSAEIKTVFYNQPYLARVLVAGRRAVLYGAPTVNRYRELVLENPEYEFLEDDDAEGIHTGRIVPVYRKLADVTPRHLRQLLFGALAELDPGSLRALVPAELLQRHRLTGRFDALRETHFPPRDVDPQELLERRTQAQRSLAFEEVFLLQLALGLRRHGVRQQQRGVAYRVTDDLRRRLGRMLPFKLTGAQKRVLKEIAADLQSPHPMNRLLQGDVGSGKTVVALLGLLVAVENGYQGALMVPTEILAEQHARSIAGLLDQGGIECRVAVLTGSLRAGVRRRALADIAGGQAQIVVGTHALFESGVEFRRLGLVVIDEQHRFGVLQRAALVGKGRQPDILVMTATPIPRSLALTLYGDLDLSVIDELPPGRRPVTTVLRTEAEREQVYRGLRREIERGRQVYVVVPLAEETAKSDLKAATEFAEHLRRDVFPDLRVGMLHGRMKGPEKESVMQSFRDAETQLLVATTVIEVGVDVPNATVMVIEHAERFGLSQLHQLRGRVGRGAQRSFCVLLIGDAAQGRDVRERLEIMTRTTDGFRIAEKDLQLRGPGAVFGTQQHGLSDLQFLAEVLRAPILLETAREEAREMIEGGPESLAAARAILGSLGGKWRRRLDLAQVG